MIILFKSLMTKQRLHGVSSCTVSKEILKLYSVIRCHKTEEPSLLVNAIQKTLVMHLTCLPKG